MSNLVDVVAEHSVGATLAIVVAPRAAKTGIAETYGEAEHHPVGHAAAMAAQRMRGRDRRPRREPGRKLMLDRLQRADWDGRHGGPPAISCG